MASKRSALDAGQLSLSAVRRKFGSAARRKSGSAATAAPSPNDLVTVQNWNVSYGSNGLTEACTVTAKKTGESITSIGLLVYSADGQTFYCSQYDEDTGGGAVSPALTTGGFSIQPGAKVLGVVFGYVEGREFFFEQVMPVNMSSSAKTKKGGKKSSASSAPRSGKKAGSTK